MLYDINHVRVKPQEELNYLFTSLNPLVSPDANVNGAISFFNVDTNIFLSQWAALTPTTPLAWNESLYNAATAHNNTMILADQQEHQVFGSNGQPLEPTPDVRALNAGYTSASLTGENIYAYSTSVFYGESGLLIDWGNATPGHRDNIMLPSYQEAGVSVVPSTDPAKQVGPLVITQDFGARFNYGNANIVGVVFNDTNHNGRYSAGEGLGSLTVTAVGAAGTFSTTTMSAGGYQIKVPAGTYTVTTSGTGFVGTGTAQVTVGSSNVEVDFVSGSNTGFVNFSTSAPSIGPAVFVTGQDSQVYTQTFDASGNLSTGYALTQPGAVKAFEVGRDANNNSVMFIIGGDDQVYGLRFGPTGAAAGSYFLAAAGAVKSLALGHDAQNNPEIFVIGNDSQVYAHKFDSSGNPVGSYFLVAAGAVKSAVVGSDAGNNPQLFVMGADSRVYSHRFDATGSPVGGYFLAADGQVKSIAVGNDASNNPMLFAIGTDNQVYRLNFNSSGQATGSYALVASGGVRTLQVTRDASNKPLVLVIGGDNQVYSVKFSATGVPSGGYTLTRQGAVKLLTVARYGSGSPEIFAVGLDNQVYFQKLDSTGTSISNYALTSAGSVTAVRAT